MNKTDKTFFVENLTQELKSASSSVLVDYSGLSVKMQQDLKKRLAKVGANMQVVKNTLFKLAGTGANSPKEILEDPILSGPTALIMSESDPIAPLQVLSDFAKEFEIPNLKVGVIEGKFQDKEGLEKLSKLPSKDVLYAQVTGAIGAPLYGVVGVLEANLQKLVFILSEASKK